MPFLEHVFAMPVIPEAQRAHGQKQPGSKRSGATRAGSLPALPGCFANHSTSQSDVVRAYIQSTLNTKVPTWVELPAELVPEEFKGVSVHASASTSLFTGTLKQGGIGTRNSSR